MSAADSQHDSLQPDLAELGNLIGVAKLATIKRQYDEFRLGMKEVDSQVAEVLPENPTSAYVLSVHGSDCEKTGDWAGAQAAFDAILNLPDCHPLDASGAHRSLARICEMLGRDAEALEHAQQASSASRIPRVEMFLAMILGTEAHYLLRLRRVDEAEAAVGEMFSLLGDDGDSLWDHLRARAHVSRAKCHLARENHAAAEAELRHAIPLLEPLASWTEAAGIQYTLATSWEVRARLCSAGGDREGAIAAWREAVRISRLVIDLPQSAGVYERFVLARMLRGLAGILAVAGQTADGNSVADEGTGILRKLRLPLAS